MTRQGHVTLVAGDGNAVARPRCGGRLSQCQVPRCRLSATTTLGCGVRQRDSVSHRSRVTCHAPARAGLSRVTQHCHGAGRDNNHTLPATSPTSINMIVGNTSSRNKKYASNTFLSISNINRTLPQIDATYHLPVRLLHRLLYCNYNTIQ